MKRWFEELVSELPLVALRVEREHDPTFVWDGDGPDPAEEGYIPCDVTVVASTIVNGRMLEGKAYLGGSYFLDDEPFGDVHGYLPQLIEEAIEDLNAFVIGGIDSREGGK